MPFPRWLWFVCILVYLVDQIPAARAGPEILRFEPTSGPAGTTVGIFGQDLANPTRVYFNGVSAQFHLDSATGAIMAIVPEGAVSGRILVFTPSGFASSRGNFFISEETVRILSFTPLGPAGANVIILLNLTVPILKVTFNGIEAPFRLASSSLILAEVPQGADSGPISLVLDGGEIQTDTAFTVTQGTPPPPPEITAFSPAQGSIGRDVQITATNLTDPVLAVQFGASTAGFIRTIEGVRATVPEGAQTGPIAIITFQGIGTTKSLFTVIPPSPKILRFEPMSAPAGAEVEIFGQDISDAIEVLFNGTVSSFKVNPVGGSLVAVVPEKAETGRITVRTLTDSAVSTESFTFIKITAFTASNRVGAEIVLVVNTTNSVRRVDFNGIDVPFSQINQDSESLVLAKVPEGASSGPISVLFVTGTASTPNPIIVTDRPPLELPTITEFSPMAGTVGSQVRIKGKNLTSPLFLVQFGGASADFTLTSDGLVATVPPSAYTGPISVITLQGVARTQDSFLLEPQLKRNREICFSWDPNQNTNIFGYRLYVVDASGSVVYSKNVVGVQAELSCDTIDLSSIPAPNGEYTAFLMAVDVFGAESLPSETIRFEVVPHLNSLSVEAGKVGDVIQITGKGLSDVTEVFFDGTRADFIISSAERIEVTVPPEASSGRLEVMTSSGCLLATRHFRIFTSYDLDLSWSPQLLTAAAGTELSFSGFITNLNEFDVTNVTLFLAVPAILNLTRINVNDEELSPTSPGTAWKLGVLPVGRSISFQATFRLLAAGRQTLTAFVAANGTDDNINNNVAQSIVTVLPVIAASRLPTAEIEVTWNDASGDFVLESIEPTALATGQWQAVPITPEIDGGTNRIVVRSNEAGVFFRLRTRSLVGGRTL